MENLKRLSISFRYSPKQSRALADSITRLSISVQKYVKAITSANLGTKAKKDFVDLAFGCLPTVEVEHTPPRITVGPEEN